ncbi:outer membrane protein transport protein [Pantoea ananatis]|uniref:outer membrane protein transport protein n=1 Tax=Pantoea ananas TaxID=553 RepID=UPI00221F6EE0|nr:outer membrane protein transport protein [Pantoea ananatis]
MQNATQFVWHGHAVRNNNMHFGTSLTVPFGFKTEYDRDWVGRYNGVKTELQAIDLNFAFSYDVNPYVSFGASVSPSA